MRAVTMIRLPVLTIKRILSGMIDAEDREVIVQWIVLLVAAIVVLIVAAGALGFAWSVFDATRRL
jgi:hypothetical protein